MHSSKFLRGLLMPLLLLSGLGLTSCGGGSGSSTAAGGTPQTAPGIAVVPQSNFNNGGNVDINKVQAVQGNYQKKLEVTQ